jgi:anti-sigma B factor antagonist
MDSSGVATLVEGLKACADKKKFILVNPSEPVMKVLKLARLDGLFRIQDQI